MKRKIHVSLSEQQLFYCQSYIPAESKVSLIVENSQTAVLCKGKKFVEPYSPGKYTLFLPPCMQGYQMYIIQTLVPITVFWGTNPPLKVQEFTLPDVLELSAYGYAVLQVENPHGFGEFLCMQGKNEVELKQIWGKHIVSLLSDAIKRESASYEQAYANLMPVSEQLLRCVQGYFLKIGVKATHLVIQSMKPKKISNSEREFGTELQNELKKAEKCLSVQKNVEITTENHLENLPDSEQSNQIPVTTGYLETVKKNKLVLPVCSNCKASVNEADVFCRRCGAPLESQKIFCPECGCELPVDSVFCIHCGRQLT